MKANFYSICWAAALLTSLSTRAGTITWTNAAGGNWSVPGNWSPNQAPGPSDDAVITAGGNYVVTLDVSPTINSLTLGGNSGQQSLNNANNNLSLAGGGVVNTHGVLDFAGASFTAGASLMVHGMINWQNASWTPAGGVTLTSGAVLNLQGSLSLYGALTNQGTVNWQGGTVQLYYDGNNNLGEIWNQAGAVWAMQCNQVINNWSGQEQFNNTGVLLKTNSYGTSSINVMLQNSGVVAAQSGTIVLNGNSNLGGNFVAAANAAVDLAGNYTNGPSTRLTGAGSFALTGGSLTLQTNVIAHLNLDGGNVFLDPTFQAGGVITNLTLTGANLNTTNLLTGRLTMTNGALNGSLTVLAGGVLNGCNLSLYGAFEVGDTGVFNWAGGTLGGGSELVLGDGAVLNIQNSLSLYGALTNQGTVNWQGGSLQLYYNGSSYLGDIWNQAGAVWNLQCDQTIAAWSGQEQFNNAGLVRKNNSNGTSTISVILDNSGTVEAQSGTIQVNGSSNLGGDFIADLDAAVDFGGNDTNGPDVSLTGEGTFALNGGLLTLFTNVIPNLQLTGGMVYLDPSFQGGTITNLTLNGTSLAGTNTVTGQLTLNNDNVSGQLTVLAGGVCTAYNTTFYATVGVNGNGVFNWNGGGLANAAWLAIAPSGILNIEGSLYFQGAVTNQGVVNWQGGSIQLYYNGSSYLGGIWNQAGAVWNLQCNQALYAWSGQEQFNNAGDLLKNNSDGTSTINVILNNSGTVEARSGTIQLNGNGNLGGDFIADADAAVDFGGNETNGPVISLTGAGAFALNGGTLALFTNVIPNLQLTAGTVYLDPSFQGGTITNLTLNGTSLAGTNTVTGQLTLNNDNVSGQLTVLAGGVCTANNTTIYANTTVNQNGVFNWGGGGLVNTGWLVVAPSGMLNIVNSLYFQGAVTNQGVVNWQEGSIQLYYNGSSYFGDIWNQAGAVWNLQCNQVVSAWSGQEQFNNAGDLLKNNSDGTSTINVILANSGTVEAQSGTIQLNGSSSLGGGFIADLDAAVDFGGNDTNGPDVSLTGEGTFALNGGLLTLFTNVIPNLQLTGGTVFLDPSFQGGTITNLTLNGTSLAGTNTVTGQLTLNNDNVSGQLTVLAGGVCTANNTTCYANTVVNGNGVFNWGGGGLASAAGWLAVAPNGILNILSSLYFAGAVTNQGTVNWQGGNLQLYYNGSSYLGDIWNQAGAVWNLQCNQGMYAWSGQEQFNNAGILSKNNSDGVSTINVNLDNAGTLDAQSGTLALNGTTVTFEPAGTMNFGIHGLLDYGLVSLSGTPPLNGIVSANFNDGYVPEVGDSFTPLTYPTAETGVFTDLNLPANVAWQTSYESTAFTLTVLQGLELPPIPTQFARGATAFTVTVPVADSEVPPDSLTFSLVSPPGGMTIDPASGVIHWTPPNSASTNNFIVTVTDNGTPALSASTSLSVIVVPTHANVAPVLPVIPTTQVAELTLVSITNTATDADSYASLTYSLVSAPAGAAIDANGVVTWIPAQSQSPSTNVFIVAVTNTDSFVASNPQLGATRSFTVVVYEVNQAPELPVILSQTVNELTPLAVTNAATEPNIHATNAGYTLLSPLAGMNINNNGVFTWTPGQTQSPGLYTITTVVTNTDRFDTVNPHLAATNIFNVAVLEVNVAPALPTVATQTVNELTMLTVTNTATNANLHSTIAGYGLVNPPAGARINANGLFTWTPAQTQSPGTNVITTIVTNSNPFDLVNPQLTATNTFTVIVKEVNVAPALPTVSTQIVNELTLLTVTNTATNANLHSTITGYGLVNPPANMVISAGGIITWTPTQAQSPGTNRITTIVTNSNPYDLIHPQLTSTNVFTVIVREVNVTPVLPVLASTNVNELTLMTVANTASDPDVHGTLAYGLVNPPAGLTIANNGVITWTPAQTQSPGTNVITTIVTNTDAFDLVNPQLYATNSFTVIVHEVNVAPALPVTTNVSLNELTLLTVTNTATNANIHALITGYALVNPPASMAITTNGIITWTPGQTQSPSTNTITTVVSNLDAFDPVNPVLLATNHFTVVVKEVNVAPVLSVIATQTVNELTLLTVTNTAADSNLHATVGYALLSAPTGVTITTNGIITWTPGQTQSPGTYTITTTATSVDNYDQVNPQLSVTNSFTVLVKEVNAAPTLPVIATRTVNELTLLTVTNTAGESNIHATNLEYTLLDPPAGAAIDTNGIITWTPGQSQSPSTNTITTIVVNDDPYDLNDPELAAANSFTVIVKEVNVVPVLPVIAPQTVNEQTLLMVTNTATDANLHATVGYALLTAPTGVAITTNGIITWTPGQTQSPGTNTITTVATSTDNLDQVNPQLKVTNSFTVIVKEVNVAPVLPVIATQTVNEQTLLTVTDTATDSNPHALLSYALLNAPTGAAISAGGVITWTPTQAQSPGTNTITAVATSTDSYDLINPQLSATNSFTVIVKEVNAAPVLSLIATQTVNELTLLTVTNAATDSNPRGTLGYALLVAPVGAVIGTNGVITWTPGQTQSPGTNKITTVATSTDNFDLVNPQLSVTNSFTVIVKEVNVAPVLPVVAAQTVNELTLLTVTNTATEANLHATLSYALLTAPTGVAVTAGGIITWTPAQTQSPGIYTITTVATSSDSYDQVNPQLSVTNSFTVSVQEVNAAPTLPVIATRTVNELTLLTVTNTASESNIHAANLEYTLLDPPAGAVIDTNGIITWTPSQSQSPSTNTITTVVVNNDPFDPAAAELAAVNSFTVIVKEVNVAPVLPVVAAQTVNELTLLTVTNTATEANLHATLSYALVNPPSGMAISPGGVITWTPGSAQSPGTNTITTIATGTDALDPVNPHLSATNTFTVVVEGLVVTLTSPTLLTNGDFEFTFNTVANASYTIEYSANLTGWTWMMDFVGDGSPFTFTVPNAGQEPQGFYRVTLSPP